MYSLAGSQSCCLSDDKFTVRSLILISSRDRRAKIGERDIAMNALGIKARSSKLELRYG